MLSICLVSSRTSNVYVVTFRGICRYKYAAKNYKNIIPCFQVVKVFKLLWQKWKSKQFCRTLQFELALGSWQFL